MTLNAALDRHVGCNGMFLSMSLRKLLCHVLSLHFPGPFRLEFRKVRIMITFEYKLFVSNFLARHIQLPKKGFLAIAQAAAVSMCQFSY